MCSLLACLQATLRPPGRARADTALALVRPRRGVGASTPSRSDGDENTSRPRCSSSGAAADCAGRRPRVHSPGAARRRPAQVASAAAMADRETDVLLIGGGIASATAAATLRAEGFAGSVLVVGRESDPPYHRPPASKGYLQGRETRDD